MYRLPLSGKHGRDRFALISDADVERVTAFRWHYLNHPRTCAVVRTDYATGKPRKVYLHRFIMEAPEGMVVDHINGDVLDNRRENLRVCTRAQNRRNRKPQASRSKFKGVDPSGANTWRARISRDGELHYLGSFPSEEEAARAYDAAAKRLHGVYARLNFG